MINILIKGSQLQYKLTIISGVHNYGWNLVSIILHHVRKSTIERPVILEWGKEKDGMQNIMDCQDFLVKRHTQSNREEWGYCECGIVSLGCER